MADLLIRDVPADVLAGIDSHAAALGLSRAEYIRRRLATDAVSGLTPVSADDLRAFGQRFNDLADCEVMDNTWR